VRHALSEEVTVHRFDPDRVTEQDYEVWHLQDVLFVVDSFAELESGFKDWTFRRGLT
jgi:phenylalanine-4-hydroxylase